LQLDQPLDMDVFLQSDVFAAQRSFIMKRSIANMISGSISFIASMLLVVHILRSYEYLSSTYHRLVFGLSAADIISSFCFALSSTMTPKEMSYLIPFASGNIATCDAQGFLNAYAGPVSVGYNCSVCLYYLAIITYSKKYDCIKKKMEPWLHGISVLFPLIISVILLATNAFNGPNGGACFFLEPHYPPHCVGHKTGYIPKGYRIPCGRGGENDGHAQLRTITGHVGFCWVLIIAPIIILVTMARMFRSVAEIEKRMQQYGVNALRFRTTLGAAPTTNDNSANQQEETRGFTSKLKEIGKKLCLISNASQTNHRNAIPVCCFSCFDPERPSSATISNNMTFQKRAVLHMAVGYSCAWLLVWTSFFVCIVVKFVAKSAPGTAVLLFTASTVPLQGFFNFLVFMAPKVRTTRTMAMLGARTGSSDNNNQNQQHLTWCQAFYKAYMDRGRRVDDRI
jgi:hypothetical protein